eukprot:XP_001710198.1 Hypothetical protein GL50803_32234 [Giardia lamblia ATCC 50803]
MCIHAILLCRLTPRFCTLDLNGPQICFSINKVNVLIMRLPLKSSLCIVGITLCCIVLRALSIRLVKGALALIKNRTSGSKIKVGCYHQSREPSAV